LELFDTVPFLLLIGFLAGFFNSYLGIGGGTVITGLLSVLLEDMAETAAVSITCCLLVSLLSLYAKRKDIKKEEILRNTFLRIITFRFIFIFLTMSFLLKGFDRGEKKIIDNISSLSLVVFLVYMVLSNSGKVRSYFSIKDKVMDFWMGTVTGILYPLTGVSGGIIFTNFFKKRYKVSYELSVFHSLSITAMTSLFAFIIYLIKDPGILKGKIVCYILLGSFFGIILGRNCLRTSADKNIFYCIHVVVICMIFGTLLKLFGVNTSLNLTVTLIPLIIVAIFGIFKPRVAVTKTII